MSPPETVVAPATVSVTVPGFAAFVPPNTATAVPPMASAHAASNKNARVSSAIDVQTKSRAESGPVTSEAAASDALAALAPRPAVPATGTAETPTFNVASTAPASNPFTAFPPFQLGGTGGNPTNANQGPQWNAMLQYYAYYSYMLANGGAAAMGAVPGAPPSMQRQIQRNPSGPNQPPLPALAPKQFQPGMVPPNDNGMAAMHGPGIPGMMPPQMGMPPMHPGMGMMTPQQMQQMAQMAAHAAGMLPPPLISVGAAGLGTNRGGKRIHDGDKRIDAAADVSGKHGRKRRNAGGGDTNELKTCVNCGCTRTPFWRKERVGGGALCNACGLYLAKNDAPRPKMLWRRGSSSGSGESTPEQTDTPPPPNTEPTLVSGGNATPPPPDVVE